MRRTRLEQRERAAGSQRFTSTRGEQRGRTAVQDRLGGGHGDDEVGLDEGRVDAQLHVAGTSEIDEVLGFGVVDDHAAAEPPPELRRHEQADLARGRAAQQSARDEDRHLLHAEPVQLVRDRSDRLVAGAELHARESGGTAARSRSWPCRLASRAARAAALRAERPAHRERRHRRPRARVRPATVAARRRREPVSATTMRASASSGTRVTCCGAPPPRRVRAR